MDEERVAKLFKTGHLVLKAMTNILDIGKKCQLLHKHVEFVRYGKDDGCLH